MEDVAHVIIAVARAHIVDFAGHIVGKFRYSEPYVVGAGTFATEFACVNGVHAQITAYRDGILQGLCVPVAVVVLEVVVYLPRFSSQFSGKIEVNLCRHVVVVAAPLGKPETGLRGSYLLVSRLRVCEPGFGVWLTEIGLYLGRLALVVTLIDILQVHQFNRLAAIGGIDFTALGIGVFSVKVGKEYLQAKMVARGVGCVFALIEYPVGCHGLRNIGRYQHSQQCPEPCT